MNDQVGNLCQQFGCGDRARFFLNVEFLSDPEPGGVTAEEQATWGRFQIWAGGRNLCAHYVDGVLYEYVTWYLLPLLEWMATGWDYLLHEQRFPYQNKAGFGGEVLRGLNVPETFEKPGQWDAKAAACVDGWARRHSLLMHREGGLFPDIWLRRLGDSVEVSWTADVPPGAPEGLQFSNGDGGVTLSPDEVARPLFSVLQGATSALYGVLPKSRRVRDLVGVVRDLNKGEKRSLRVGILAGLGADPAKWHAQWESLVRDLHSKHRQKTVLINQLFMPNRTNDLYVGGECAGALMFASVSPTIDAKDALALAELLLQQADARRTRDGLREHSRVEPVKAGVEPWMQGYALAWEWAETAKIDSAGDPVDIEAHLRENGVQVTDIRLTDTSIGAVAIAHGSKRPLVAVNVSNGRNTYPPARRFTLAHELCHLLYDRNSGVELQIVSGAWAPVEIEQRANAFAAALLMPDNLIDRVAGEQNLDLNDLDLAGFVALAKGMDVSLNALGHHLVNRRWIDESQRLELMIGAENNENNIPAR